MSPEEIPDWKPLLKRIPLFKDLSSDVLKKLISRFKPLSLPRGATLFHQGDAADAFYIITSGQVQLLTERQGAQAVSATFGRGETLGELALLTGEPRPMTARLYVTTEFLVLSKRDFAAVLRDNPSVLMQIARTLSSRLLQESRGAGAPSIQRQTIALVSALGEEDQTLFTLYFALSFVEQTRRRVLLVDMNPRAGGFSRALGMRPEPLTEEDLRQYNLRDSSLLRQSVSAHASGLGVMTLPADALGGRLFKSIFLLMNLFREHSDFVILSFSGTVGEVERSVLAEADQWVILSGDGHEATASHFRQALRGFLTLPQRLLEVWLGDKVPLELAYSQDSGWVKIPWSAELGASLRAGQSPFAILEKRERSRCGIDGLTRRFAGLRVGLALGTGAALGYSLIGILKTFRKEGIPIDIVSGTSMGAVIGSFYSLGLSPEEIEDIASGVDRAWVWENLFWDLTVPRAGIFEGTTLLRFLRSYFGNKEFRDLDLPFACVATDIENGEGVVFREGRVAEAVRASCGIPLIFQPFRHQGRFLVDGGLVDPVPTDVLGQMGADIHIAVNLTVPAGERKTTLRNARQKRSAAQRELEKLKKMALPEAFQSPNMIQVFFQMIYTMEYEIARSRASMGHVYIHPDLTGFSWTELHRAKELIAAGSSVAEAVLPKIKGLLPYFADHCKVDIKKRVW